MQATPPSRAHSRRYRVLARSIAALHTAYVIFAVLGGLLVLRWPSLLAVHMLAVLWALATLFLDFGCWLTQWEKALWRRGGVEPYPEGFLQHHVLHSNFTAERSRLYHAMLGGVVLVLNAVVYSLLVWR